MSTKVLVFESDAAFASELRNELGKLGCNTHVVDDGNVGLQQAAADKPDLILLSIELPRMNGFSVCNKLKKDPSLKDVPLIIMSSESSDETFEQHRKLRTRAEDYVHKPIAFGELLQHIQSFVRLGAASEGQIVIDDEIALASVEMEDEGTQIAKRPDFSKPSKMEVDPDVDAFADAAFGMLQGPGLAAEAAAREVNGARPSDIPRPTATMIGVAPPGVTQGRGGVNVPPPGRVPSVPPRALEPDPELERLRGEVERASAKSAELEKKSEQLEKKSADLERELDSARETTARLEQEAARAEKADEEAKRMQRDIDELKAKLGAVQRTSASPAGVSSREFLDLREALNKKDKEILNLKEQLTKKDKEILETSDKALTLERVKADVDDRVIALEGEVEEAKDKISSLAADKDQAKKLAEDFKARHARAQSDVEARLKELADLRAKGQAEEAAHEAAVAGLRVEMQQAIEREQAAKQRALEEAEEVRLGEAEAARKVLEEAKEYAARERSDAVLARERELRQEADQKLAALHRAQQEELNREKAELGRQIDAADAKHAQELAALDARRTGELDAAQREATERLALREAELEARRVGEVETLGRDRDERLAAAERDYAGRVEGLEKEHAEKVAALEQDRDERLGRLRRESEERVSAIENDRDARIAGAEAKAAREIAEARAMADAEKAAAAEQIASLEGVLATTRQALGDAQDAKAASDAANAARIQELEQAVAQVTAQRDETHRMLAEAQKNLGDARDRITLMEAEIASLKSALDDTRRKLDSEGARATKAYAKWESDRASLDRAKDALAVALQQIEEAEARSLSD